MTFTEMEQEAIVLNAVIGMVDDMVNQAIFCSLGEKRTDTNLLPQTSDTLRQFGILLRDFLSPVVGRNNKVPFDLPKPVSGDLATDHTTLFYLRRICESPQIGQEIGDLRDVVDCFINWLEGYAFVEKVWFSKYRGGG